MEPQPCEPDRVSAVSGTVRSPIVVMGVSGSGKSTVGSALAQRLQVPFLDADTLHRPANIAKMPAAEPLNDDDRHPWLEKVGQWLASHRDGGVVACSALRRKYRDQLRAHCARVEFLHLRGSPELIGRRLAARSGHFMPAALLHSQFDALEPLGAHERGVVINLSEDVQDPQVIVATFLAESAARQHT